jgi:hypothetical protein
MKLVGCDVYVHSPGEAAPEMPKSVGPLRLEFISNRGTRIWPKSSAELDYHADEWRFRFTSEGDKPVAQADINALLRQIMDQGRPWTRVQVLLLGDDGARAFSQPY